MGFKNELVFLRKHNLKKKNISLKLYSFFICKDIQFLEFNILFNLDSLLFFFYLKKVKLMFIKIIEY